MVLRNVGHNPEDLNLSLHRRESLKYHVSKVESTLMVGEFN
jgi:hypothetical protein